MRNRKKIDKVSDFKKDPDMRIVFTKDHHPEFLQILNIGENYKINPTTLSRNVLMIWNRRFQNAVDKESKDKMILEVIQSIHGVQQLDLLAKGAKWEVMSTETTKDLKSAVPGRVKNQSKAKEPSRSGKQPTKSRMEKNITPSLGKRIKSASFVLKRSGK